jgi:hypothetical protein
MSKAHDDSRKPPVNHTFDKDGNFVYTGHFTHTHFTEMGSAPTEIEAAVEAASHGYTEVVQNLLTDAKKKETFSPYERDDSGSTLLHYAAQYGHQDTVETICAAISDSYGRGTDYARRAINFTNKERKSAADLAKENGYQAIAEFLRSEKAVNVVREDSIDIDLGGLTFNDNDGLFSSKEDRKSWVKKCAGDERKEPFERGRG